MRKKLELKRQKAQGIVPEDAYENQKAEIILKRNNYIKPQVVKDAEKDKFIKIKDPQD